MASGTNKVLQVGIVDFMETCMHLRSRDQLLSRLPGRAAKARLHVCVPDRGVEDVTKAHAKRVPRQ